MSKKSLRKETLRASLGAMYWESLKWKPVDVTNEDLGEYGDSVFFGLEELDGNAFAKAKDNKKKDNNDKKNVESDKKKRKRSDSLEETHDEAITTAEVKPKKGKKQPKEVNQPEESSEKKEKQPKEVKQPEESAEKKGKKQPKEVKQSDEESAEKKGKKQPKEVKQPDEESSEKQGKQPQEKKENKKENKETIKKQKKNSQPAKTTSTKEPPQKRANYNREISDELLTIMQTPANWGGVSISSALQQALLNLDFQTPTAIQACVIPTVFKQKCDIVGVAETGSGKTLAYVLPILHSLLTHWPTTMHCTSPYAIILSPTRELAVQISSVITDLTHQLYSFLHQQVKIETVTVIGGLSEDKQRRLLDTSKKSLHILIATPGRFQEIVADETINSLQDLSSIHFLVIDEVDRMIEDGHFPELFRLFSTIAEHEKIRFQQGGQVSDVLMQRKHGVNEEGYVSVQSAVSSGVPKKITEKNDGKSANKNSTKKESANKKVNKVVEEEEVDEVESEEEGMTSGYDGLGIYEGGLGIYEGEGGDLTFPEMPSEEALAAIRQSTEAIPYSEEEEEEESMDEAMDIDEEEETGDKQEESPETLSETLSVVSEELLPPQPTTKKSPSPLSSQPSIGPRQTLLFSATALSNQVHKSYGHHKSKHSNTKTKMAGTLRGIHHDHPLPVTIKELLSIVAIQKYIDVLDVTHGITGNHTGNGTNGNTGYSFGTGNGNGDTGNGTDDQHLPVSTGKHLPVTTGKTLPVNVPVSSNSLPVSLPVSSTGITLPKTLSQYELRVPGDEKDDYLYAFLLKHPGRCLIFVNSIKSGRRVDGLLRALHFPVRPLHSQLTQKQRLNAMEFFRAFPQSILVATDVAARGVDVPNIQYVVHYEVARSVQLYVHRVGRTARAGKNGVSLSLVNPGDTLHHQLIVTALVGCPGNYTKNEIPETENTETKIPNTKTLKTNTKMLSSDGIPLVRDGKPLPVKGGNLPVKDGNGIIPSVSSVITSKGLPVFPTDLVSSLTGIHERIALAKSIFTMSFVFHAARKENHWLAEQARDSDLPVDDRDDTMYSFTGNDTGNGNGTGKDTGKSTSGNGNGDTGKESVELRNAKLALEVLLAQPLTAAVVRTPGGSNATVHHHSSSSTTTTRRGRKPTNFLQPPDPNDWKKRRSGFFVYAK